MSGEFAREFRPGRQRADRDQQRSQYPTAAPIARSVPDLIPSYENVHRGQSTASQRTTELFEESYDTIAAWLNAPSRRTIATYRNTTEAHNAVMYSLLTEFRDGTTLSRR